MQKNNTVLMILCSLFAALTAILSQLSIPIGPVPINLATLSVFCAGALLGAKFAALSQLIYVLVGIIGIPVFSMFRGGLGVVSGPTGGYIIGYVVGAGIIGLIVERAGRQIHILLLAMLAGFLALLTLGTLWFMFLTKSTFVNALVVCVLPFLIGDAAKIAVAAILSHRLYPVVAKKEV